MANKDDVLDLEELCDLMANSWPPRENGGQAIPEPTKEPEPHLAPEQASKACYLGNCGLLPKAAEETPLPILPEVQRVLSLCQDALQALIDLSDPEHAPYADVLGEIIKLRPRIKGVPSRPFQRHRKFSLSMESRQILKQWFDQHIDSPYPTPSEKTMLARLARMNMKQVNDWFTNYRKRHWSGEETACAYTPSMVEFQPTLVHAFPESGENGYQPNQETLFP